MFGLGSVNWSGDMVAYLSLILWSVVMIGFSPSAWRYVMGKYNLIDSYRTAGFFMAVLWVVGLSRLIFLPQAEDIRISVLALSCVLAAYMLILAYQGAIKK